MKPADDPATLLKRFFGHDSFRPGQEEVISILRAGRPALAVFPFPKYGADDHRTKVNFYLALLEAAGAPRDSFGMADPALRDIDTRGPFGELLA